MDAITVTLLGFIVLVLLTLADLHFERGWVGPVLRKLRASLRKGKQAAPGTSVLIVPTSGQNIWFLATSTDHAPAMSISGHWNVMNLTNEPVHFIHAFILRPRAEAAAVLVRCPPSFSFGDHAINPGSTSEAVTHFWVQPAVCGPGEDFRATIVFVDQLANEHAVENVRFRYL